MFHILVVALYCLLGVYPVFVAGTGRETSSPYIDKPGILTPIFRSISGVHVRVVQQFLPVPFRSVPERSGFSSMGPFPASFWRMLFVIRLMDGSKMPPVNPIESSTSASSETCSWNRFLKLYIHQHDLEIRMFGYLMHLCMLCTFRW